VLASGVLAKVLINRGRGFIFSTAPSPLMAAAVRGALRLLETQPYRQQALHRRMAEAARLLEPCGAKASGSQIIPLIIGGDDDTMRMAEALQAAGFDVRGIRPPTVPQGTSRLRISITLNVTEEDIAALAHIISEYAH